MVAGTGFWFEEAKSTSKLVYINIMDLGNFRIQETNEMINIYRSPGKAYVEGDASSASYFLAGAAVTGGTITVEGCGTSSLQVLLTLVYHLLLCFPFATIIPIAFKFTLLVCFHVFVLNMFFFFSFLEG